MSLCVRLIVGWRCSVNRSSSSSSNSFWNTIFGWLPGWVGFAVALLVGVLAIIFGFVNNPPTPGLIAFGVAAIISIILAWLAGARATPRVDPFKQSFGAVMEGLDSITSVIIIILFVIAIVIAILVK